LIVLVETDMMNWRPQRSASMPLIKVREFRRKAAQLRRIASIPTQGDSLVNRDLLFAAQKLERLADAREKLQKAQGSPN
jgi:hypothetical protein